MSGDDETRLPAGLPGAGPRQSMSLPHNIRPEHMVGAETPGARWKRFNPVRKLQRMFRRKSKTKEDDFPEAAKAFSASQLPPDGRRRSSRTRDSPPLQCRLSMSHDSIFQSECGGGGGGGGGGAQGAEMGSALSIPSVPGAAGPLTAELRGVLLKRRADDSDDDPGLPHSPASPSTPPATSRHQSELKGQSGKSGGSCSDGSLLSMYSSGTCTDDDIFGPLSKHPSRVSLSRDPDAMELETTAALSHSAAKHRISVRPRRNHGVPRQRRSGARPQTCPPATGLPPTVEEESPPATPTARPPAPARPAVSSSARLNPDQPRRAPSASPSRSQSIRTDSPEGATAASSPVRPSHVKRSKSSVADGRIRDASPRKFWAKDPAAPATAAVVDTDDRRADKGETFFSRIFGSRRSGRKKKEDRSLSPEQPTEPVPVPARRPPMSRHRSQFSGEHRGSPASALHADIIRPPPSDAQRGGDMAEPHPAEFPPAADAPRQPEFPWAAEGPRAAEFPRSTEGPRQKEPEVPRSLEVLKSVDLLRAAESPRSAEFARTTEPGRPVSEFARPSESLRPGSEVPRPPPEALRRGPAFLADVRAEVAALAAGGDRGDDTVTVSPQVLRRHRASAAAAVGRPGGGGSDSPLVRPRLVGLTAYQQRVAHLKRSPSPEAAPSASSRRSFSCEDVSEEEQLGSRPCSGMALGSVLSLIKSTVAAERPQQGRAGSEEREGGVSVPLWVADRRESSGPPAAGPKSLDSSLLGSAAEPPPPPPQASSVESVQSGGAERTARGSSDQQLPEFLRVQLHRVEGRQQRDSAPPAAAAAAPHRSPASLHSPGGEHRSTAPERRDSGRDSGRDSSEREAASSPATSDDSPPQLRRRVAAARAGSPDLPRRPSQTRSRSSTDSEPVVLRSKTAGSEDSELLKVFKRRSLKCRDSDELPAALAAELGTPAGRAGDAVQKTAGRGAGGDEKENEQPREETEETVVCVSVPSSPPRRPESSRLPPAAARPLSGEDSEPARRAAVTRRDSELTRRDSELTRRDSELTRRDSEASRRSSGQEDDSSRPAGWLRQAVKERREQREQREQKHFRPAATQKELLIESESAQSGRAAGSSRSSRVLEMANTFQKLQTT